MVPHRTIESKVQAYLKQLEHIAHTDTKVSQVIFSFNKTCMNAGGGSPLYIFAESDRMLLTGNCD